MTLEEFDAFKAQLQQLCAVLGRRFDDSLCQAYWTVLRSMPLTRFQAKCKGLMESADADTRFPRPAFFLPREPREPSDQEITDGLVGDRWDVQSNHLLFAHIRQNRNIRESWGAPNSRELIRATQILVKYKKQWAAMMREWGVSADGELEIPPAADQNSAWQQCMKFAADEIQHPELDSTSQLMQNWYGGAHAGMDQGRLHQAGDSASR